ncbi:hypothetical protein TNIN_287471 [Trichonephila inaurata madagascariensis]|uniref:Uncharacterized protein n=1 Tax=Trichonephila inaurata madagascariensis TaxID=2747483 RepID=A0A8X6XHL8_9ARAC|nr:hypothetical protein TNIN_287471 [Trichonephila inaurata madagascariensis]
MGLFDFRTQGRGGQIKKARKASYSKPDVEIGVCGTQHRIPHCCAFKTNLWPAVLSFDAGRPQSISTAREYLFTVSLESFLRHLVRRFPFIYFYVSMRTFTLAPVKRCLISTNPAVELLRKFDLSR